MSGKASWRDQHSLKLFFETLEAGWNRQWLISSLLWRVNECWAVASAYGGSSELSSQPRACGTTYVYPVKKLYSYRIYMKIPSHMWSRNAPSHHMTAMYSHIILTLPFLQQNMGNGGDLAILLMLACNLLWSGESKLVMLISVIENLFNWKSLWWKKKKRIKRGEKRQAFLCLVNHSKVFSTCRIWKISLISQLLGDVFLNGVCRSVNS